MPNEQPPFRRILRRTAGLLALCVVHAFLVVDTLLQKTPTVDEIAHLPAGQSYLEMHDFRAYAHNPPLARVLPALAARLPIVTTGAWLRRPTDHWGFAWDCMAVGERNPQEYLAAFTRGRLVIAAWSMLTLPVLFCWACWWFGDSAGWLAALLYCFCPNIVAHAGMVTTDLAAASTTVVACFLFARWLERPSAPGAVGAGALLGLALLTKFSAIWLALIWPVWAVLHPALAGAGWRNTLRRLLPWRLCTTGVGRGFLGLVAVSWFVVNAGYLFQGRQVVVGQSYHFETGFTAFGDFGFVSQALTRPRTPKDGYPAGVDVSENGSHNRYRMERVNRFRDTLLDRVPCPFPYEFVAGFDDQKWESESKYQMYFHGALRSEGPGWWQYYLVALAIKTPLGLWCLIVLAVCRVDRRWNVATGRLVVWAALAATPILVMTLLTDINLGLRYVLPALPFLFLLASAAARAGGRPLWRWAAFLLVGWNALETLSIHPHEMAYFNELVGGPRFGREWLIDSNIDWGQDLRSLARWRQIHPEWRDAKIAYWGSVPLEFEGIHDALPPPRMQPAPFRGLAGALWPNEKRDDPNTFGPHPGKYVVSVNYERGHQFHLPTPAAWREQLTAERHRALEAPTHGLLLLAPENSYSYFKHFTPRIDPTLGYSLLLYDISLDDANRVRRSLGLPPLLEH